MPMDHQLERRAQKLAEALQKRIDALSTYISPKGSRPPFKELLRKPEALEFWRTHLNDEYGARVLQQMQPLDVIELHQALAQADSDQGEEVQVPDAQESWPR